MRMMFQLKRKCRARRLAWMLDCLSSILLVTTVVLLGHFWQQVRPMPPPRQPTHPQNIRWQQHLFDRAAKDCDFEDWKGTTRRWYTWTPLVLDSTWHPSLEEMPGYVLHIPSKIRQGALCYRICSKDNNRCSISLQFRPFPDILTAQTSMVKSLGEINTVHAKQRREEFGDHAFEGHPATYDHYIRFTRNNVVVDVHAHDFDGPLEPFARAADNFVLRESSWFTHALRGFRDYTFPGSHLFMLLLTR